MARLRTTVDRLRALVLAWFARLVPEEHQHTFVVTVIVGLACGLVAVAFHLAIQAAERQLFGRAVAVAGWPGLVLVILLPAAGGLAAGVLLTWVVPGARGSGIPQVKRAYALGDGRSRGRSSPRRCSSATRAAGGAPTRGEAASRAAPVDTRRPPA